MKPAGRSPTLRQLSGLAQRLSWQLKWKWHMSQSGRGYDISRCLIYNLQLDEPLNQVCCLLRASFSAHLAVSHAAVIRVQQGLFSLSWYFPSFRDVPCEPWRRPCPCDSPSRSAVCEISTLINFPPRSEDWCDLRQVISTASSFALPRGCLC